MALAFTRGFVIMSDTFTGNIVRVCIDENEDLIIQDADGGINIPRTNINEFYKGLKKLVED